MDFRSRRHERGSNWTDQEIVELLQLWSDESVQIELESSLRNQRVFDRIANILREKGIYRTGDQCREKIKKMKLEYRRIKDNHKMRSWKFYDVMDKVLANRPAITYSSLGGGVIAQQVFHSSGGPEPAQGGVPVGSFGPVSSGGFQFGQPPKIEDSLDIKCEDDADMLNSGDAPPEMYYCSGDDQETDGQSLLGPEDNVGRGESSANARISPSGFSDLNIANSASAVHQDVGGPEPQEPPKQPRKVHHLLTSARQKKRHRGGKAALNRKSAACSSQGRLEEALTRFLSWQQSAEERLLSMEEARLQRALQEEERREQREERRAERERQHELRLFSMLTGALVAVRQGAPTTVTTSNHLSHPAPSSSYLSQPSSRHPSVQTISTQEPTLQKSTKACEMAQKISVTSEVAATPGCTMYLSHRGNSIRQQQGILQEGFVQYSKDKYHDTEKPEGIINLGTSENKLCYDVLHKRLTKDDMLHTDSSLLQYPDWRGHHFLREEVAKFLTDYCCSPKPLKAENVVVMNGCTSLFCCLAAVLCDPKDVILIPTPFYGAITEDMQLYSDVRLYHVHLEADGEDRRNFHLTVEKLEEGLKRAKQEGFNIRGVILMNPHNPLAEIYTTQEMIGFLEFAKRHKLHAIVDEVYMLSVFDDSVTFHSVLSVERLPDPQRTHVMWGMGKDFAMAGMRIGTLYTENRDLVEALAKMGSFHGVTGTTQHQVAQLLHDRDWINKEFLPENRRRLKAAHMCLASELTSMGIPYLHRPAALYIWADLRKYLGESSFERELSLWRCFLQHKVVVSCGQAFACSTPGWFRIVFADKDQHLKLGMKRFKEALKEFKEQGSTRSKDVSMEGKKSTKDSENAVIVKATSSPQHESCDQLKEKDSTVLHTELATDEFVLLDCQKSKPTEGLDSLIGTLRHQIRSSDWLEKNTPELSTGEDPEILDVFKVLLQRARK